MLRYSNMNLYPPSPPPIPKKTKPPKTTKPPKSIIPELNLEIPTQYEDIIPIEFHKTPKPKSDSLRSKSDSLSQSSRKSNIHSLPTIHHVEELQEIPISLLSKPKPEINIPISSQIRSKPKEEKWYRRWYRKMKNAVSRKKPNKIIPSKGGRKTRRRHRMRHIL